MSTSTTRLALVKPALTDPADITATNGNWDTLDKAVTAPNGATSVKVQYGTVTVSAANGATTAGPVTFPTAFASAPQVVAVCETSAPNLYTCGVASITATGFNAEVWNTSGATTSVNVRWIAVGS